MCRYVSFLVLPLICKMTVKSYSHFPLLWFILFVLQYSYPSHSNNAILYFVKGVCVLRQVVEKYSFKSTNA